MIVRSGLGTELYDFLPPPMNSFSLRIALSVLLGLSVSIVPVRPHYGLATRHDSPGSTLLPRKQQRIRVISLRGR